MCWHQMWGIEYVQVPADESAENNNASGSDPDNPQQDAKKDSAQGNTV